jgi:hypothetical protein
LLELGITDETEFLAWLSHQLRRPLEWPPDEDEVLAWGRRYLRRDQDEENAMKPIKDEKGDFWIERKAACRALGVTDAGLERLHPQTKQERVDGHLRTLVRTKDLQRKPPDRG